MIKEILKSDVGILNKYFLVTLILVLLTIVGYTSYALFSYEEISTTGIRIKYTGKPKQSEGNLSRDWQGKTANETSYLTLYTLGSSTLPSTYDYNGTTYTKSTEIDVSEQSNGNVILGEYTNGSSIIAVIGQDGGVMAPIDSSSLFSFLTVKNRLGVYLQNELQVLDLSNLNTSNVTDMSYMLADCNKLTTLILGNKFTTKNVTNMGWMFYDCASLTASMMNLNLSSFDTSQVTNMGGMFFKCSSLTSLNLSSFDTSNVTDMSDMFRECSKLTKVTVGCNWQEAGTKTYMFYRAGTSSVTKEC